MHAIFHKILRTISIQSPDHDTQALERAPVFCCTRVFFDAVGAALRVAIEAGQTKGLILRHPPLRNELQGPQVAPNSLPADLTPTCHSIHLTAPTMVPVTLRRGVWSLRNVSLGRMHTYCILRQMNKSAIHNIIKKLGSWNRLHSSPHALQTKVDN